MSLIPEEIANNIATHYQNGDFSSPDHNGDPELKNNPEFYEKVGTQLLGDYYNNRTAFPYQWTLRRSFGELRLYASGTPPEDKYIDQVVNYKRQDKSGRKSFVNISWAPTGITGKVVKAFKGIAQEINYDVKVNATDAESFLEKKQELNYQKIRNSPVWQRFEQTMKKAGVKVDERPLFSDEQEQQLFAEAGGLKLGYEIALEAFILNVLRDSKFKYIKDQLIEDIFVLGVSACQDYMEGEQVMARWVDPEFMIARYSRYKDYRNIDIAGEQRIMTVGMLRRETNLSDKDILMLIQQYNTKNLWGRSYNSDALYAYNYFESDNWRTVAQIGIPVLDFEFISSDVQKYTSVRRAKEGNLVYKDVPYDYELSAEQEGKGKKVDTKYTEFRYKAKLIMGTTIVFDYGRDTDIHRQGEAGNKRANLSYHIYDTKEKSAVETIIPLEDEINIATFKQRDALAKLPPPPGLAIDNAAFENITIGGIKMDTPDMLQMFGDLGYLIVNSLDEFGKPSLGAQSTPVKPLFTNDAFASHFRIYFELIEQKMKQIADFTGINDLVTGSQSTTNQGLGLNKISVQGTYNILAPTFRGYESLLENLGQSIVGRAQELAATNKLKVEYQGLGKFMLDTLELGDEISTKEFDVFTEALPSGQEKQQLLVDLTELQKLKQAGGKGGITIDDAIVIKRQITLGNVKLAELLLSKAVKKTEKKEQQTAERLQKQNGDIQTQSAQAAEQGKRQTALLDHELKIKELQAESRLKRGEDLNQGEIDADLIRIKAEYTEKPQTK